MQEPGKSSSILKTWLHPYFDTVWVDRYFILSYFRWKKFLYPISIISLFLPGYLQILKSCSQIPLSFSFCATHDPLNFRSLLVHGMCVRHKVRLCVMTVKDFHSQQMRFSRYLQPNKHPRRIFLISCTTF